eukprot:8142425-Pyramimonas_sp.AAC.1
MDSHKTQRDHTSAVHLSIHTRVDKGFRIYVQSPKNGPEWDHVVRRVTMHLDDNQIIQDIKIQDQPIVYNFIALLSNGASNIRTRFYWEQPEPALIGRRDTRPRPRRVAFVDDDRLPPPSIERGRALPSKADKEAGIKPRSIPNIVEEGNDDCGDDLKGLGCSTYYTDVALDSDTKSDDEEETCITLPAGLPAESDADVLSITPTLFYGRPNNVDMLELCGGSGGISQLAFSRGLSSGGNLDKRSFVKLGNKDVQGSVMHYLGVCFVNIVTPQTSRRTTGLPSYFKSHVNYGTCHANHEEDLPHIKFCGRVAIRQKDPRGFCSREQPVGTWVDQIPPWTTLATCKGTCNMNMDQRDSHGVLVRKPTEIMANRRLLLTPFERRRCAGHHQHAS